MKLTIDEIVAEAQPPRLCGCGSGLERDKLWSVGCEYNYVMEYYCTKCEAEVKGRYRPGCFRD